MLTVPKGYVLKFYHIETDQMIFGKRVTDTEYRVFDPETGEVKSVSRFKLLQNYRSCGENKKLKTKRRIA